MGRCNPKTQTCTRTPWWRAAMGIDWIGSGGGGEEPFDPLTIESLEFWFDNNDQTTITTSSGAVTAQSSKKGSYTRSKPAAITAPVHNPLTVTDELGHFGFSGAHGLDLNVGSLAHQQGELFIVFRRLTTGSIGLTNNQFLMTLQDKDVNNRYFFVTDLANSNTHNNSLGINCSFEGSAIIGYCSADKSISDKKTILNIRSTGSAYAFGFDRNLNRAKAFASGSDNGNWFADVPSCDLISFGYRNIAGLAYSTHYEYEILYFNAVLSDEDRASVLQYLNDKHDCYKDINYDVGVILCGSSNASGQSAGDDLPNRLKVALPKGYIRTGTDIFANLLYNTNNEGSGANMYGSEMSFIAALSEYLNRDIYLDKLGSGGSRFCVINGSNAVTGSTTTFKVSVGGLYATLETGSEELQSQLNLLGTNKIILFLIGGENDVFYAGDANGFKVNADEVIDGLISNGANITHFIINKIKSELAGTGPSPTRQAGAITTVQNALETIKNERSNSVLLDMVNYTTGEGVHFQDVQHLLIGRDAFEFIKSSL